MNEVQGARIHITGIVQGVGFRPFVYGLAARLALTGWVRNTSAGVDIEVDGPPDALQAFQFALRAELPPLARIDEFQVEARPADGFTRFEIIHSEAIPGAFQPISPDVAICPDCMRELFDPGDRRYRYPFINCTNCGPRFTIIQDIPYDRLKTTMAAFEMCPDCGAEYNNPLDRRFHAQPVACPVCGPQVWLEFSNRLPGSNYELPASRDQLPAATGQPINTGDRSLITGHYSEGDEAIFDTQKLFEQGRIVAIKGLGGFHLACDALNMGAVQELRERKLRVDKPFALMMPDVETVEKHCLVSPTERELLESRERPIVLLHRRPGSPIPRGVAPGQDTVGVLLPYTGLHYLLFDGGRRATDDGRNPSNISRPLSVLVMTSGNLSEEPIATDNEEARERLGALADAFLMHDRPIHVRCDDSVVRVFSRTKDEQRRANEQTGSIFPIRRSRGYAPFPVRLPWELPPLLAVGAELKNTFCITHGRYAFISHHIGDLENYETLQSFQNGAAHFERLFRVQPQLLAYDLHPDYLSTRYALERSEREGLPATGIQHHHAHIAACLAEHGYPGDRPVIGIAFDGTGYGDDGAIWGGEFLLADYRGYRRVAHLDYVPLPGGDAAIRRPARTALAYLWQAGVAWDPRLPCVGSLSPEEQLALATQIERGLNAPLASSTGRLFDAVAAIAGGRQKVNYEAQAAIELEATLDPSESKRYLFKILPEEQKDGPVYRINPAPVIWAVAEDRLSGLKIGTIAARFHNGLAQMVLDVCRLVKLDTGINQVALSGGVWQNLTLLEKSLGLLKGDDFDVLVHRQVPTNDGGISLGQAAVAASRLPGWNAKISD